MRIKRLSIKNLGRHKNLEATLDGSVIGLMGPNGSGKSTILKIIHFLFTGWTPAKETQESFIRRVDPALEAEPVQGSAEIDFYAQGNTYCITRKIGSPSSRKLAKLDINGKEIKDDTFTRSDEIQAVLTDILGADKYAMDNAVFPEQGQLDKILFGSQAEREELLVKLLLLGHMQKVADVTAGKIKLLNAEIQDFSTLHDELQSARNAAESELASAEHTLTRSLSYETEIKLFEDWEKINYNININGQHLLTTINSLNRNKESREEVLNNFGTSIKQKLESVNDLDFWIKKLEDKIAHSRSVITSTQAVKTKAIHYKNLLRNVENYEAEMLECKSNCPNRVDAADIRDLNNRIQIQKEISRAEVGAVDAKNHSINCRQSISIISDNINKAEEKLADINDKMGKLNADIALYKTITDTCSLALHSCDVSNCPVCGENLVKDKIQSRLSEFGTKLNNAKIVVWELNKDYISNSEDLRNKQRDLSQAKASLDFHEKKIKEYEHTISSNKKEDVSVLEQKLNALNAQQAKHDELFSRILRLQDHITACNKELCNFSTQDQESLKTFDVAAVEDSITKLESSIAHWNTQLSRFNNVKSNVLQYDSVIKTEQTQIQSLENTIDINKKQGDALFNSFPPKLKDLVNKNECNVKEFLKEKNKEFTQLQARVKQLKINADSNKKRLKEIEDKISFDEEKRKVIADLQKIIAAFSRQGIPMAYVQHKFDALVSMTQDNLEIMDANFAIIPNPDKPVSLMFYRLDEPGQVLFEHDKLSGGQKVRLSIAFLLAVQQLVIPDLGFLVLDEPSTHLDEESRENLKELLINLSQQLETTDTQILVCDHAKELEPAFLNLIQL